MADSQAASSITRSRRYCAPWWTDYSSPENHQSGSANTSLDRPGVTALRRRRPRSGSCARSSILCLRCWRRWRLTPIPSKLQKSA